MQLIKGDITQEMTRLIVHGTNTVGGFGSGVAGAIRRKWPAVYLQFYSRGTGKQLLGTLDIVEITPELFVGNGYTQENCGNDGKRYANTTSIDQVLNKAFSWCYIRGFQLKAPKIGAGLGGLDWETDVKPIFLKYEQIFSTEAKIFYI